jgi:hypothetical protein
MDDFNVSSLHESKNEWGSRLLTILTPLVLEGLKSIFDEATQLCRSNNEMDKYLMTFQNFISRIPKWNSNIIEMEKNRIVERSGCGYMEDLVTCVHIIQLKLLTAIRVGQKQKKIDINIPKLDDFIHKIYVNVARKIYKNVYLFELNIPPLQVQKHHREIELIIQECILNTVRESIPVESILRAYMDETIEEDVTEEIREEVIENPKAKTNSKKSDKNALDKAQIVPEAKPALESEVYTPTYNSTDANEMDDFPDLAPEDHTRLSFSDIDNTIDTNNNERNVNAPKTMERLNEISDTRYAQRKYDSDNDSNNDSDNESNNESEINDGPIRLQIQDKNVFLDSFDVHSLDDPDMNLSNDFLLNDIEVLV